MISRVTKKMHKTFVSSRSISVQSGHSAGDATCLHYCLNLWSTFHDLTYLEVISGKETDKSMLDLHSRNLATSSIDAHTLGASPKQVLEILWQMNAEQDVVEVESFLLEGILTYVSVYGWYEAAFNISATASTDPDCVIMELKASLASIGIECE